jgi:hypothetical protein
LLANGSLPGSARPIAIAPGRAPEQLLRILEALGGIGPMTMASLADLLELEGRGLPLGATLAVVTALMPERLAAALRRFHDAGQHVVVLATVDDDWSELLGGMALRRVVAPVSAVAESST